MKNNDVVALFDKWSVRGLDREMERGHHYAVRVMLNGIKKISQPFDFLDVGCGNGWTVQEVSKNPRCRSAWGIDLSDGMIRRARMLQKDPKLRFLRTDLLTWNTRKKFDVILSMETLYYVVPVEPAVIKIYNLLKERGVFLCGVDYYRENKASHSWPKKCGVRMDLRSKKEWTDVFRNAGFKNVRQKNILYPASATPDKWKQRFGTLLTRGVK